MIALIAAVARNGVIGKDGKIPWHISRDLRRFKELTMGHVLIVGRRTYESVGRPLPGRTTIVLTRTAFVSAADGPIFVAPSLLDAIVLTMDLKARQPEISPAAFASVFICGGAEVYCEALERDIVDRMYLTAIEADFEGDTYFPKAPDNVPGAPGLAKWVETFSEKHFDEKPPYEFLVHERRR